MAFYNTIWYGRGAGAAAGAALLRPLSWIFAAVAGTRRALYRQGLLQASAPPVPVVIVGGITVGGAGKTPLCIALLKELQARGLHPGLISRGYRGQAPHYPYPVTADSKVEECGDEPLLIKRGVGEDIPVLVDPVRERGARELWQMGAEVILSDDGLQHYALARDLEIVVVDGARGLGNGALLPAGPLREGASRLKTVDLIISNGPPDPHRQPPLPQSLPFFTLVPAPVHALGDRTRLLPPGQPVCALGGIANPGRFYATLSAAGYEVAQTLEPGDHARVDAAALQDALSRYPVVMTAKDAVKYEDTGSAGLYVLEVEAQIGAQWLDELLARIAAVRPRAAGRGGD